MNDKLRGLLVALLLLGTTLSEPAWAPPGKRLPAPPEYSRPTHRTLDEIRELTKRLEPREFEKTDKTELKEKIESIESALNRSTQRRRLSVGSDLPNLKIRAADNPARDIEVLNLAHQILDPQLNQSVALERVGVTLTLPVRDSATEHRFNDEIPRDVRDRGTRFERLLDHLSIASELPKISRLKALQAHAGELILLLGHHNPTTGRYEYLKRDGTTAAPLDIQQLQTLAAEAGVFLLAIGCKTARSTSVGTEQDVNSYAVVGDVARALKALSSKPATLRILFRELTASTEFSIDLLTFRNTRVAERVDSDGHALNGELVFPPLIYAPSNTQPPAGTSSDSGDKQSLVPKPIHPKRLLPCAAFVYRLTDPSIWSVLFLSLFVLLPGVALVDFLWSSRNEMFDSIGAFVGLIFLGGIWFYGSAALLVIAMGGLVMMISAMLASVSFSIGLFIIVAMLIGILIRWIWRNKWIQDQSSITHACFLTGVLVMVSCYVLILAYEQFC